MKGLELPAPKVRWGKGRGKQKLHIQVRFYEAASAACFNIKLGQKHRLRNAVVRRLATEEIQIFFIRMSNWEKDKNDLSCKLVREVLNGKPK